MSVSKAVLLTGIIFATAALTVPAAASALLIKDNGETVSETVTFSGEYEVNTLGSGTKCPIHMTVVFKAGIPELTALSITTPCTFFGVFAACEFEPGGHPVSTNLPQAISIPSSSTLTLKGGKIDTKLRTKQSGDIGSNCPTTKNDFTITSANDLTFDLTTNIIGKINGIKLTGTPKMDQDSTELSVGIAGTLNIDAAHSGTYNVE